MKVPTIVAATMVALAVSSCATTDPQGDSAHEQPAISASANHTGADPGVDPYQAKHGERPKSIDQARDFPVILGTVSTESHGTVGGEIDHFAAVHSVTVRVDEVLHGNVATSSIVVGNGRYVWTSENQPTSDARRTAEVGQPWLHPGEKVVLILKKLDEPPTNGTGAGYHTFGDVGTYRVVDGKISEAPRTRASIGQQPLVETIVGMTPAELKEVLDS